MTTTYTKSQIKDLGKELYEIGAFDAKEEGGYRVGAYRGGMADGMARKMVFDKIDTYLNKEDGYTRQDIYKIAKAENITLNDAQIDEAIARGQIKGKEVEPPKAPEKPVSILPEAPAKTERSADKPATESTNSSSTSSTTSSTSPSTTSSTTSSTNQPVDVPSDTDIQGASRQQAAEQKQAAVEEPGGFLSQLIAAFVAIISRYFTGVKERVDDLREGQNSPGGLVDTVQRPAIYGLQMLADLFSGYERYKNVSPQPQPEQQLIAQTAGGGKEMFAPNPDYQKNLEGPSLEDLGDLKPNASPNRVGQSQSASVGQDFRGRSLT